MGSGCASRRCGGRGSVAAKDSGRRRQPGVRNGTGGRWRSSRGGVV